MRQDDRSPDTDRVAQQRAIDDLGRQGPVVLPEVELLLTDPDPRRIGVLDI